MRLYQQFRASIVRSAVVGAGVLLFASGMSVSAFGQAQQASAATPAGIPARQEPAGPADAGLHRGSGPDGAREQPRHSDREAEPADPGPRRVAGRAAYAPVAADRPEPRQQHRAARATSTRRPATSGHDQLQLQDQRRHPAAARSAGGNYSVVVRRVARARRTRSTTSSIRISAPASNADVQPAAAARTSRSISCARRCSRAGTRLQTADLQLQQRITQTVAQRAGRVLRARRRHRRARSGAGVARSCRARRSRTTRRASRSARWRRSTSSPRRRKSRATKRT